MEELNLAEIVRAIYYLCEKYPGELKDATYFKLVPSFVKALQELQNVVNIQSRDSRLWGSTCDRLYIQEQLRFVHSLIEEKTEKFGLKGR